MTGIKPIQLTDEEYGQLREDLYKAQIESAIAMGQIRGRLQHASNPIAPKVDYKWIAERVIEAHRGYVSETG